MRRRACVVVVWRRDGAPATRAAHGADRRGDKARRGRPKPTAQHRSCAVDAHKSAASTMPHASLGAWLRSAAGLVGAGRSSMTVPFCLLVCCMVVLGVAALVGREQKCAGHLFLFFFKVGACGLREALPQTLSGARTLHGRDTRNPSPQTPLPSKKKEVPQTGPWENCIKTCRLVCRLRACVVGAVGRLDQRRRPVNPQERPWRLYDHDRCRRHLLQRGRHRCWTKTNV